MQQLATVTPPYYCEGLTPPRHANSARKHHPRLPPVVDFSTAESLHQAENPFLSTTRVNYSFDRLPQLADEVRLQQMKTRLPPNNECQFLDTFKMKPHNRAKSAWLEIFNCMPYGSFWMLHFLIKVASTATKRITVEDVCEDPKILKKLITKDRILKHDPEKLAAFPFKPGGCASFTVQVCRFLQPFTGEDSEFNFEYHDLGRHRLSRCQVTHVVNDSSSDIGAYPLEDGASISYGEEPRAKTLKWTNGEFHEESVSRDGKTIKHVSKKLPSESDTIATGLHQFSQKDKLEPLCYFREALWKGETGSIEVRYHGMIKWDMNARKLYLIERLANDTTKNRRVVFDWGITVTGYHRQFYGSVLAGFIYTAGGPHALTQWEQCYTTFRSIWLAACKVWSGSPSVTCTMDLKGPPSALEKDPLNGFQGPTNYHRYLRALSMYAVDQLRPDEMSEYTRAVEQMTVVERMSGWGQTKTFIQEDGRDQIDGVDEQNDPHPYTRLELEPLDEDVYPNAARIPKMLEGEAWKAHAESVRQWEERREQRIKAVAASAKYTWDLE